MTCGSFRVHGASAQPGSPGGGSVWHGDEGSLQRGTQGSAPSPLPSPHPRQDHSGSLLRRQEAGLARVVFWEPGFPGRVV